MHRYGSNATGMIMLYRAVNNVDIDAMKALHPTVLNPLSKFNLHLQIPTYLLSSVRALPLCLCPQGLIDSVCSPW